MTGGRKYGAIPEESDLVWSIMDGYWNDQLSVAQGGAQGVDRCIIGWWRRRTRGNNSLEEFGMLGNFPAQWDKYGASAGHERNERMLKEWKADLLIAFPGGAGTADCKLTAKRLGITIHEYDKTGKGTVHEFGSPEFTTEILDNYNSMVPYSAVNTDFSPPSQVDPTGYGQWLAPAILPFPEVPKIGTIVALENGVIVQVTPENSRGVVGVVAQVNPDETVNIISGTTLIVNNSWKL